MRTFLTRMFSSTGVLVGLIVLILLFGSLNLVIPHNLFSMIGRYWPVVIVGVGLSRIIGEKDPKHREGAVIIGVGAFLQLLVLGWLPGGFHDWWPLGFILLGLWMLFVRPSGGHARVRDIDDTSIDTDALFEQTSLRLASERFDGGAVAATFATVTLDLGAVCATEDGATLSVDVVFAVLELILPRTIQLDNTVAVFAGKLREKPHDPAPDTAPRLLLTGSVRFGTLKVRWHD